MNTQQKVATVAGTAAVLLGAYALYRLWRSDDDEEEEEDEEIEETSNSKAKKVSGTESEGDIKAASLKEKGNEAFTKKNYEKAISLYTEALQYADTNQHLYYSNRSAAYLANGNNELAVDDALKCLELKPKWSKGYYRLGKAYLQQKKFQEAYRTLLKGLSIDSASTELRELLEVARSQVNMADFDATARLEEHIEKKYLQNLAQDLCTQLGLNLAEVQGLIESTVAALASPTLHEVEPLKHAFEQNAKDTLTVILLLLLHNKNTAQYALPYATQAKALDDKSTLIKLLYIQAALADRSNSEPRLSDLLALARESVHLSPEDPFAAVTLANLVVIMSQTNQDFPIREILQDLLFSLSNPKANHLIIADAGVRIWFKLLEDPEVARKLQAENISQPPDDSQMLRSIIGGGFRDIMMEPFLLQTLLEVTFNNPTVESLLGTTARKPLLLTKPDAQFDKVKSLIFSIGVQCYRNSYAWPYSPEERKKVSALVEATKTLLTQDPDTILTDGVPDVQLTHHLALIAMYRPLDILEKLPALLKKVNFSQLHPSFALLLTKSVVDRQREEELLVSLKALTDVPEDVEGTRRTYIWDNAGLSAGKLATLTVEEELEIVYKHSLASTVNNNGRPKILVVGCGSGQPVYQAHLTYSNADVYGVDPSPANIAFAVRQLRDLGAPAEHLYIADLALLEPSAFPDGLFDVALVSGTLALYSNPIAALERIGKLLKPGAVVKIQVPSAKSIENLALIRRFLTYKMQKGTSIFSRTSAGLPEVLRQPTDDEARKAREHILTCQETDIPAVILYHPAFYSLAEFIDHVFHPHMVGFTFEEVYAVIEKAGLKLVKFEFTSVPSDHLAEYQVHTGDEDFSDARQLTKWENEHPEKLLSGPPMESISALAQKPL